MSGTTVSSVERYSTLLQSLLQSAGEAKLDKGAEIPIKADDLGSLLDEVRKVSEGIGIKSYAAIETACRTIFYRLLATTRIESPDFSRVWNLFDILSIISDLELCEPGLVFWLVEELLDSQTIDGCRIVFDYLDWRREILTAKHFKQKNLIILRACNELLRRLSRAEDTVFCGRVFIFLFQSFPLGDRSSVNLRGEFHTENATTYEKIADTKSQPADGNAESSQDKMDETPESAPTAQEDTNEKTGSTTANTKSVKFNSEASATQDAIMNMDMLYATFWSMQEAFSHPTKLFEAENLKSFQSSLGNTLRKFKAIGQEQQARGTRIGTDSLHGDKRKRGANAVDSLASSFNPKYLTSRDLFDLEINDLSFRRHILVQSLILLEFLLSLTPRAKRKLDQASNKSVLYPYTLNDENAKWATSTRNDIATYLQQGPEGKFYYRMVDTVLSRDKNWAYWKAEGCPPIAREPITASDFAEAEKGAQRASATKRIRPVAMGTLDLKFLEQASSNETEGEDNLDALKDPSRYTIPGLDSFKSPIEDDQFEIEMAKDEDERVAAIEARASKLWRTLRIASKSKLSVFDKIDDGNNLAPLFDERKEETDLAVPTEENEVDAEKDGEKREERPQVGSTENVKDDSPEEEKRLKGGSGARESEGKSSGLSEQEQGMVHEGEAVVPEAESPVINEAEDVDNSAESKVM